MLAYLAIVEDDHRLAHARDDTEIVRDEQHAQPELTP